MRTSSGVRVSNFLPNKWCHPLWEGLPTSTNTLKTISHKHFQRATLIQTTRDRCAQTLAILCDYPKILVITLGQPSHSEFLLHCSEISFCDEQVLKAVESCSQDSKRRGVFRGEIRKSHSWAQGCKEKHSILKHIKKKQEIYIFQLKVGQKILLISSLIKHNEDLYRDFCTANVNSKISSS